MRGKVKFFDNKKGFGFITGEDGIDSFVHYSEIQSDEERKSLKEGQEVIYDRLDVGRGPTAFNVKKIEE
ncbi:MAG: cold shock domain-containing protein [Anaerococcus sp.]|jgi:CspA family cold shock protein|nr:cold shock domain-containing protein [Peptoniphilaceae bacterium]MDY3054704.1 cold shock domain-containing protein [Anaerococcus sp.]